MVLVITYHTISQEKGCIMIKVVPILKLRRLLRPSTVRLIVLSLIVTANIAVAAPAFATHLFDGGSRWVANNTGAAATIETAVNPTVASGGSSSAWPMVVGYYDADQQYIQVGWCKDYPQSAPVYFWEYSNYHSPNQIHYMKYLGTSTIGSYNDFMVGRDSSTWYAKINGNIVGTVGYSALGIEGYRTDFLGETFTRSDHMPGITSNKNSFGSLQYKDSSFVWHTQTVGSVINDATDIYANNAVAGAASFWIWDKR